MSELSFHMTAETAGIFKKPSDSADHVRDMQTRKLL